MTRSLDKGLPVLPRPLIITIQPLLNYLVSAYNVHTDLANNVATLTINFDLSKRKKKLTPLTSAKPPHQETNAPSAVRNTTHLTAAATTQTTPAPVIEKEQPTSI